MRCQKVRITMALRAETTKIDGYARKKKVSSFARKVFIGQDNLKVSVVIPAMNEEENLPYVLPRIPSWVYEILLVDGFSTDRTVDIARQLTPGIRIVSQKGRGKGAALRTGFNAARGDIIVMLDADGSTDPGEIPIYVGALLSGADFAKGSRFLQGGGTSDMPLYRKLGNWSFVLLSRIFFGSSYTDLCYGYNAFWKYVLPDLNLDGNGFEIETMMNLRAVRAGLHIMEVPSFEYERIHGEGYLQTIPDGWRVLKTIFREYFRSKEKEPKRMGLTVTERRVQKQRVNNPKDYSQN
jgi:glycosyltransferase involved in cell wall biosynthesis